MAALDYVATLGKEKVPFSLPKISVPAAIALMAVAVAVCSLALRGFEDNGFRLASRNAWRFGCLVFFAASMAGPLGRLVPGMRRLAEDSCLLFQGFCASYGVYLMSVLLPNAFSPESVEGPGLSLFVLFSSFVTLVMALSLTPRMAELAGGGVRRALLGVSTIYFWLCYALMGLAYISRPHRPDDFYGLSLCLMVVALLARFADNYRARLQGSATVA